jgi:AcrR family transcriptional regulator
MARTDPRIAQTRRAVLHATLQLIAERGFQGATIERVAEVSGVARSTIYRRWPDPSRLYIEAFAPLAEAAFEPPTGAFADDLRRYLTEYAARLNDDVYFAALLALIDRAAREPEWATAHRGMFNETSSRAGDILRAGVAAGSVRADVDVERAVADILSPFVYIRMIRFEKVTEADRSAVRDELVARFGSPPPCHIRPSSVGSAKVGAGDQEPPEPRRGGAP